MNPNFAGTAQHPLGVQPFSIRDGALRIATDRADPIRTQPYINGFGYTSGAITTELTFWHAYEYYEMRAKLSVGKKVFSRRSGCCRNASCTCFRSVGAPAPRALKSELSGEGVSPATFGSTTSSILGTAFTRTLSHRTRNTLVWIIDGKPI
jgi:hypothetical protein